MINKAPRLLVDGQYDWFGGGGIKTRRQTKFACAECHPCDTQSSQRFEAARIGIGLAFGDAFNKGIAGEKL